MQNKAVSALLFAGGVLLAGITYAVLYGVVERGPVYDFMCGRGYYQHVSTALLFWGLLLIAHRWFAFKNELRSLQLEIPTIQITPEDAEKFAERIPREYRHTIFGRRVAEALRGYARHEDVGPLMDRLAQNDRENLERSASLLSWVRSMPPVLGLLGTLDGLRGGTAEIAIISGADSLDRMRTALQHFALASSTAFDCTLMGILCALVLSMFIFLLRKREDAHLSAVDLKADMLSRRFRRGSGLEEQFRQIANGFMAGVLKSLEESLAKTTEHMLQSFDKEMREGITQIANGWLQSWRVELSNASNTILARFERGAADRESVTVDPSPATDGRQAQGKGA